MNNIQKIKEWFNQMGYYDDLPETLNHICTNSTSFIWDQLMENTKPRQEIDLVKKNLIINRLQKKTLNQQDEFGYPMKELTLYSKKQKLETKLKSLEAVIAEKHNKVNSLSRDNKLKYIFIEKVNTKIKANEERKYILNKKSQMLETKIQDTDDMLTIVGNITPVEVEENSGGKEITEVLEECAKKLEQALENIPLSEVRTARDREVFYSTVKANKLQSYIEKCSKSEKKSMRKLSAIKRRDNLYGDKENKHKKCIRKLFNDENSETEIKTVKRESLGLLPESCYEDSFNSFSIGILQEIETNTSVITKTSLPQEDFINVQPDKPSVKKICNDKIVCEKLSGLLHTHNRQFIWNMFQNLDDNLHLSLVKNLVVEERKNIPSKSITQDDISKLQTFHVLTEFKILKNNALIRNLGLQIQKKKEEMKSTFLKSGLAPDRLENTMRLLNLHLEEVGLDASLAVLKKEINLAKNVDDNNDLQMVFRKLGQVKEKISSKMNSINQYLQLSQEVLTSVTRTREETMACVRKLEPFVNDSAWSTPLTQNLHSQEMKVFEKFPLEYNRRFTYTDPSIYYHNICTEVWVTEEEFDTDILYMLSEIMENPLSPPETILLNLLQSKMRLDFFKGMKNYAGNIMSQKYSLDDLKKQEIYLQFAIDRLLSINNSQSTKKVLAISSHVKKMMDIWTEMPFKNFVSTERKLDGQDYKYYEKQYDGFYNNL